MHACMHVLTAMRLAVDVLPTPGVPVTKMFGFVRVVVVVVVLVVSDIDLLTF